MPDIKDPMKFMKEAIALSLKSVKELNGGPFGAVIVKDNNIIATGYNQVTHKNDPTAHAEIVAIRAACKKLNTFQLSDCVLFTSCEPCPMCISAIYWARIPIVYFGNLKEDAAQIGFDDQFIYEEIDKHFTQRKLDMKNSMRLEAGKAFEEWLNKENKILY